MHFSSVDNGPKRLTFILMFHRWRGIASVKRDKTSCCDTSENMLLAAGITTRDINERRGGSVEE